MLRELALKISPDTTWMNEAHEVGCVDFHEAGQTAGIRAVDME